VEEQNQQPDNQDDTETDFEMQPEETTVAVAQNPAMNGSNGVAHHPTPSNQVINKVVTERYSIHTFVLRELRASFLKAPSIIACSPNRCPACRAWRG
jgi:hypothetical protein